MAQFQPQKNDKLIALVKSSLYCFFGFDGFSPVVLDYLATVNPLCVLRCLNECPWLKCIQLIDAIARESDPDPSVPFDSRAEAGLDHINDVVEPTRIRHPWLKDESLVILEGPSSTEDILSSMEEISDWIAKT